MAAQWQHDQIARPNSRHEVTMTTLDIPPGGGSVPHRHFGLMLGSRDGATGEDLRARSIAHLAFACLYYHAGGANCQFGDFQGCMYAAQAYGGNCRLSPSWRARYGDQLPPLERWQYGGTPCVGIDDARCY